MRSGPWRLRWTLLVLLAAVGVHAGRYALAPEVHGDDGTHGYLQFVFPLLVAASLLVLGEFAALVVRLRQTDPAAAQRPRTPAPPVLRLWGMTSAVLLAVYFIQETGEALLGGGGAHELFALFGHGAWVVLPLALVAGALIAMGFRGAVAVVAWAARAHRPRPSRAPRSLALRAPRRLDARASVLALSLAARGPPLHAAGA